MSMDLYIKPNSGRKAFTLLEILIAGFILTSVLIAAYSVLSKPGQYSAGKMDELVTYGQCKRIAMFLHEEVKNSRKIWYPNSKNPSGEYFVTEHTDGSRNQFYFDRFGNFMARRSMVNGGLPKILVRAIGNKVRLKNARFVSNEHQKLEISLKYELSKNDNPIMEFFDSVSIPK